MARKDRLVLHAELVEALQADRVYFQPPEHYKLSYPCVIYERSDINTLYSDNVPYGFIDRYTVTSIGRDADGSVVERILELPGCSFDRHFVSDGLYHDVFTIARFRRKE